jgi:TonB family protein
MSTIVKESEVSSAVPEALSAPAAGAAPSESAARPQPVALEVSVTVNGARTLDGSDKREPFSESTKTVLVFGNGAVIRLQSSVAAGQLLFLTNEKTKKEVVCQVVKSKNYRNVSGYVELEFTEPVVGFWGMRFPNDRVPTAGVPSTTAPANVNAAPASGSPAAPVAAAPNSAPAKVPAAVPAPPSLAPVATSPALHETKTPSAPPPAAAPSAPSTSATVTPIAPFISKSSGSTTSSSASSSALPSSSVLTLPRAAQPKSAAPPPIQLAPPQRGLAPQPLSGVPAVPQEVAPSKTAAENATDALRAENARLQEQLTALLSADGKKNDAAKSAASVIAASVSDPKPADSAAQIFELAHASSKAPVALTPVTPKPAAVAPTAEKVSSPAPAPIAQPPASQSPVIAKPVAPGRASSLPLPSLREEEHVKIPSWLEPLARNAAVAAPSEEAATPSIPASSSPSAIFDEPIPDAHWLNKDGLNESGLHKDVLHAEQPHEDGADHLHEDLSPENSLQADSAQESVDNIPTPDFGSRFLTEEKSASEDGAPKSSKLVFVGIAAAVIFAAAGGYWYTHQGAFAVPGTAAQNAAARRASDSGAATAVPQETLRASNTPATTRPGAIVNQIPTPAALNTNMVVTPDHVSQPTNVAPANGGAAPPLVVQPAAAQPKHPVLGEVHLAAPMVTRAENSGSAADVDPTIALNGSVAPADTNLGGNLASTSGPVAPSNPIPIGGDVKSAQLLKSVPPVYPSFAKTQRISGDVKIDALIDATGKVTTMKVVGGPTLLHQAAMDALHQWKYQPATLDGKAVPMHLTVTIQFRMQ